MASLLLIGKDCKQLKCPAIDDYGKRTVVWNAPK